MTRLVRYSLYTVIILFIIAQLIPYNAVDPELAVYEQEYLTTVQKYCTRDKYLKPWQKAIYFQQLDYNNIAYCQSNHFSTMKIVYNIRNWNTQSEDERFASIQHELFHCYFGVGHSDDPKNFMYAFENYLSKQVVIEQEIALLKKLCNTN